tara:strand:+ start:160 stop:318 length:159 start_codon:yes stop_codon:yes gene_type:complete
MSCSPASSTRFRKDVYHSNECLNEEKGLLLVVLLTLKLQDQTDFFPKLGTKT